MKLNFEHFMPESLDLISVKTTNIESNCDVSSHAFGLKALSLFCLAAKHLFILVQKSHDLPKTMSQNIQFRLLALKGYSIHSNATYT